ncbi:hypothetical protein LBMAG42_21780 [Deltaproteobacteria bacterium]|nr:hypothetical protein LBMAG42_21780 [Deltaproteobacteria bacterium]
MNLRGLEEAREVSPADWDAVAEQFLGWAAGVWGAEGWQERCIPAFVRFSSDVIFAQARYEADGHYENSSFAECNEHVYSQRDVMDDYLWGVFITNFCWSHHMELSLFFRDRFLARLPGAPAIVEIAPGHGGWGVWALSNRPDARLQGFDISPSSIAIASSIAKAAGVADRVTYTERNALDLATMPTASADAVICSFLIEHLEDPGLLVANIANLLKPGARGYLAGAITAAQVDHIYEFKTESELVVLCEQHGLRVVETLSVAPKRTLRKAQYLPRSMGLILEKAGRTT